VFVAINEEIALFMCYFYEKVRIPTQFVKVLKCSCYNIKIFTNYYFWTWRI